MCMLHLCLCVHVFVVCVCVKEGGGGGGACVYGLVYVCEQCMFSSLLLYIQRAYGLLGTGIPGRPPRLSHSS